MKKVLLILLAWGLYASESSAQIGAVSKKVTSNSMNIVKVKKVPFEKTFYFAAGGELMTAANKYYKFNLGFEAAFGYQMGFKRGKAFGSQWGMELGVTCRGYKYKQLDFSDDHMWPSLYFSPFNYTYRIGLGKSKKTWIEPHIGAFICYDLNGHEEEGYYSNIGNGSYSYLRFNEWGNYDSDVGRFDGGLNIGARIWFAKRVGIDLSYRQCFAPEFGYQSFEGNIWRYNTITKQWEGGEHFEKQHEGPSANISLRVTIKLNK